MDWLFTYTDPSIDWNYAMITLVVRFIGVFVVMALVQVSLQAASRIIRRIETRAEQKSARQAAAPSVASLDVSSMAAHEAELDGPAVAAIGLALALEAGKAAGRRTEATAAPGRSSSWAMAGRLRSMR